MKSMIIRYYYDAYTESISELKNWNGSQEYKLFLKIPMSSLIHKVDYWVLKAKQLRNFIWLLNISFNVKYDSKYCPHKSIQIKRLNKK